MASRPYAVRSYDAEICVEYEQPSQLSYVGSPVLYPSGGRSFNDSYTVEQSAACPPGYRPAVVLPQSAPQCPPGYVPQCPPGYAPQCPPGYAPQCPPGFAPQCPPGFVPQYPPGYVPQYPQIPSYGRPISSYPMERYNPPPPPPPLPPADDTSKPRRKSPAAAAPYSQAPYAVEPDSKPPADSQPITVSPQELILVPQSDDDYEEEYDAYEYDGAHEDRPFLKPWNVYQPPSEKERHRSPPADYYAAGGKAKVRPSQNTRPPYGIDTKVNLDRLPKETYSGRRSGYENMWRRDPEAPPRPHGKKIVQPPPQGPIYDEMGNLIALPAESIMKLKANPQTRQAESQLNHSWESKVPVRPVRMKHITPPKDSSERSDDHAKPIARKYIPGPDSQLEVSAGLPKEDAPVRNEVRSASPKKVFPERLGVKKNKGPFYTLVPPYWTEDCVPSAPLGLSAKRQGPKNRYPSPSVLC